MRDPGNERSESGGRGATGVAAGDGARPLSINALAGALAAACGDVDVLARLAGPLGEAARAAAAERPSRTERVRWAQIARAAVPAGLRGAHPSWIEAALVELPARARVGVAAGGGDAIDTWLARWATAAIPPMPAISAARVTSLDSATRVDAATLEAWFEDAGADQLALALGAAGGGAVAAAGRLVGDRLAAAVARIAVAPRAGALGTVRAAIERCRVALDEHALLRIGARAIAPHTHALARRQLVHRLPRPRGLVVGAELVAAAGAPVSDAPRWDALAAAPHASALR